MPMITVKPVAAQMERLRDVLRNFPHAFEVAAQSSISETVTHGKASIADTLFAEVNMARGQISKTIVARKPSLRNLVGCITLTDDVKVWLIDYLERRKRMSLLGRFLKGKLGPRLSVLVRRVHPLARYPVTLSARAFVAVMPTSEYIGIFERLRIRRRMKSGRYKGRMREVIRRMRGPAPLTVFRRGQSDKADTLLNEALADLDTFMLARMVGKTEAILSGDWKYMSGRVGRAFKD